MNLLLLSNSKLGGQPYLGYASESIKDFFKGKNNLAFIPYAAVTRTYDAYEKSVKDVFGGLGISITSVHHSSNPIASIKVADGIVVGGGNTWVLLKALYDHKLIGPIKEKVEAGTPYMGWSAGSNIACPTIKTTNDMPIAEPPHFQALGLVPFQINPHYPMRELEGHFGETREERLLEFIKINPTVFVTAMREGLLFDIHGKEIAMRGVEDRQCRVLKYGLEAKELKVGDDFCFLLEA